MKNRNYSLYWLMIAIAIVIPIVSFIADYFIHSMSLFSRSGALTTLLAVIVEYKTSSHIYDDIQRALFHNKKFNLPIPLKAKPTKKRKMLSYTAQTLIVIGTLIWGYGDLVWPRLKDTSEVKSCNNLKIELNNHFQLLKA